LDLRVFRLNRDPLSRRDYFEIGVRLDSVQVKGVDLPIYAVLVHQAEPPVSALDLKDKRANALRSFPNRNKAAAVPSNVSACDQTVKSNAR
jgi:hypothetical protein